MSRKVPAVKFSVSFPPDVFERLDAYCEKTALQRSALIRLAVSNYLDAVEMMPNVKTMLNGMSAVIDGTFKGQLNPDEAKEKLDSISAQYELLSGKSLFK